MRRRYECGACSLRIVIVLIALNIVAVICLFFHGSWRVGNVLGGDIRRPADLLMRSQDADHGDDSAVLCGRCRRVRQLPLATTDAFPTKTVPNLECTWSRHVGTYLAQYAYRVEESMPLLPAQILCERLGASCVGVTCSANNAAEREGNTSEVQCSVREGDSKGLIQSAIEVTYVKKCPVVGMDGRCERPISTLGIAPWQHVSWKPEEHKLPVVIMAHSREKLLGQSIKALLAQPDAKLVHLIVSLDKEESFDNMERAARASGWPDSSLTVWRHSFTQSSSGKEYSGQFDKPTAKISRHYFYAFDKLFAQWDFGVFIEEDLAPAPDFVALFRSTLPLLRSDASIRCVSAWNDFGWPGNVHDQCRLFRTSFFPGLGFLLGNSTWQSLRPHWLWPNGAAEMGWDYWTRMRFWDAGWECVVPEVSRIRHLAGEGGSSVSADVQKKVFDKMMVSEGEVLYNAVCPPSGPLERCWAFGDLGYLRRATYEALLVELVDSATKLPPNVTGDLNKFFNEIQPGQTYALPYNAEDWLTARKPFPDSLAKVFLPPVRAAQFVPDLRTDHGGMMLVTHPPTQAVMILLDRRLEYSQKFAPFLPDGYLAVPETNVSIFAATVPGISCTTLCMDSGYRCNEEAIAFISRSCEHLAQNFGCERGCQAAVGAELPAYVQGRGITHTDQQCLIDIRKQRPSCSASHKLTRRLCACVPKILNS